MKLDYVALARDYIEDESGWKILCGCSEYDWCSQANSFVYDFGNGLRILADIKNGQVSVINTVKYVSVVVKADMSPMETAWFGIGLAALINGEAT